jgi:hypothetical protein
MTKHGYSPSSNTLIWRDDSPSVACSTASALRLHPATLALGQFQGPSRAEAAAPANLGSRRVKDGVSVVSVVMAIQLVIIRFKYCDFT